MKYDDKLKSLNSIYELVRLADIISRLILGASFLNMMLLICIYNIEPIIWKIMLLLTQILLFIWVFSREVTLNKVNIKIKTVFDKNGPGFLSRAKVNKTPGSFKQDVEIPSGTWMFGELHTIGCKFAHIHTISYGKQPIDLKTRGYFTGLFDANGQPIFEGDILALGNNDYPFGDVEFHPNGYFFINTGYGNTSREMSFRSLGEMLSYRDRDVKFTFHIIGNIHDNPELLKGGEK